MGQLNENIVFLRKGSKMSQSDLAEQLFVTPQAVSRWERGETEPDIDTIKHMAEIFGCSVEDIVVGPSSSEIKKLEEKIHKGYLIGSCGITVASVVCIILAFCGANLYAVLIPFSILSVLYLVYVHLSELFIKKIRKPADKQKEDKEANK